ncbi:MAG: HD domain-containing phosphohydrolase [Jatrophihabitantaceae bacterium]
MLAALLRTVIVAVPLAAGYAASVLAVHLLAAQLRHTRWWLLLALAISLMVCAAVERLTRRLLPLAALLKLSMLFPDQAPNRFRLARGAASTKLLNDRVARARTRGAAEVAEAVLSLITALTAHDRRTRGHCERVRVFAELLGEQLHLPREARDRLRWAALLHDIGKLRVAPDILNKPSKLSNAEWRLVAEHPATGEELLGPLVDWLDEWGAAVRQHHEHYDGSGYPDSLAGHDISRAARIVAIVDSYEVMTAHRAYKKPMATVAARAELARCAGTQFDPTYVRAFLSISLPRLLWAMGPGALLMNIPMLRLLAQTPKVLAAAPQGAAAAVVAGGLAVTLAPHAHADPSIPVAAVHSITPGQPGRTSGGSAGSTAPGSNAPGAPAAAASPGNPNAGGAADPGGAPNSGGAVNPGGPNPGGRDPGGPNPGGGNYPAGPTAGADAPGQGPPGPSSTIPAGAGGWTNPSPVSTGSPAQPLATVQFTTWPTSTITVDHASVEFTTDSNAVAAWCSLDGASARECTGGTASYGNLADGPHTIEVWATNADGAGGPAHSAGFTVDTTAPVVTWTSTPPAVLAVSSITAKFEVNDPSATARCALDGHPATDCSTGVASYAELADGTHSISVYAIDPAGNAGPAITTSVTIATGAPALLSKQALILLGNSGTVRWTAIAGLSYQYSLDGSAWKNTSSGNQQTVTLAPLVTHTFRLRGTDSLGNHTATTTYAIPVIL